MFFKNFVFISIIACSISLAEWIPLDIDTEKTLVTLRLSHNLTGRFDTNAKSSLTGKIYFDPQKNILIFKNINFSIKQFKSVITLRDQHLKKHLKSSQFPTIHSPKAYSKIPSKLKFAKIKGQLVFQKNPIPIEGIHNLKIRKNALKGLIKFNFSLSQFKISAPSYMGLTIEDKVEVHISLVARPEDDFHQLSK